MPVKNIKLQFVKYRFVVVDDTMIFVTAQAFLFVQFIAIAKEFVILEDPMMFRLFHLYRLKVTVSTINNKDTVFA